MAKARGSASWKVSRFALVTMRKAKDVKTKHQKKNRRLPVLSSSLFICHSIILPLRIFNGFCSVARCKATDRNLERLGRDAFPQLRRSRYRLEEPDSGAYRLLCGVLGHIRAGSISPL